MALLPLLPLLLLSALSPATDDWPQWRGPQRDGVWREDGVREDLPEKLEARWRVPIGSGYAAPSVAGDLVFLMDRQEEPDEVERVHAFDRSTGERRWSVEYPASYAGLSYPAGPRCAPLVADGRVYTLGSVGHLRCLDAGTGEVVWGHDLRKDYGIDQERMPIWGISASPILEGELLIVPASAKDGACLVAFEAKTGKERWRALDDRGNYSAPIIIDQAGSRVLVYWSGDRVVGLDPATGGEHWSVDFPSYRMPLGVASPVPAGEHLFLTGFYDGSLLLRLDPEELAAEKVWARRGQNERSTDALHVIIGTPLVLGEHVYGVDSYGELRCLELATGDRVWEDQTAVPRARWSTIHMVQRGEQTWMFNERGELLLAELSPEGFEELGRVELIEPTLGQLNRREGVCWSHPAFAERHIFVRSDEELACFDLSAPE